MVDDRKEAFDEKEKKHSSKDKSSNSINDNGAYTLEDLADYTGVSKTTISRAFNKPDKVKASTLKVIREAAQKMGYKPSRVARRLRVGQGNAKVMGLIIPDIMNPFFADITKGVEDVAYTEGYVLILNNSNESQLRQKVCIETLQMEGVDGIILPPVSKTESQVKKLVDEGYAIVCVDRKFKGLAVDSIVSDNQHGAYIAVRHLIGLGHERIAYIGGIPTISTSQERANGYKKALREHNIEIDPQLIFEGDSKQRSGESLAQTLFSLTEPPTALFTGNNLITVGALATCRRLGIRVPEELAIVGYDDVPWASSLYCPPTVVNQPGYEIGRRAAKMLISRIKEPEESHVTVTLDPKFLIRDSCGANK